MLWRGLQDTLWLPEKRRCASPGTPLSVGVPSAVLTRESLSLLAQVIAAYSVDAPLPWTSAWCFRVPNELLWLSALSIGSLGDWQHFSQSQIFCMNVLTLLLH